MTTDSPQRLTGRRPPPGALLGMVAALAAACSKPIETPQPETRVAEVSAKDTVLIYLYLIGDAGAPNPRGEPVLQALGADLAARKAGERLVVYLGDNIYMEGMPDSSAGAWMARPSARSRTNFSARRTAAHPSGPESSQSWLPGMKTPFVFVGLRTSTWGARRRSAITRSPSAESGIPSM